MLGTWPDASVDASWLMIFSFVRCLFEAFSEQHFSRIAWHNFWLLQCLHYLPMFHCVSGSIPDVWTAALNNLKCKLLKVWSERWGGDVNQMRAVETWAARSTQGSTSTMVWWVRQVLKRLKKHETTITKEFCTRIWGARNLPPNRIIVIIVRITNCIHKHIRSSNPSYIAMFRHCHTSI
jgi:hypothetical protein